MTSEYLLKRQAGKATASGEGIACAVKAEIGFHLSRLKARAM